MTKYSIKNTILYKDGIPALCPFAPAFPKPIIKQVHAISGSHTSGFTIERFSCVSNCAHFEFKDKGSAELKCSVVPNIIDLIEDTPGN